MTVNVFDEINMNSLLYIFKGDFFAIKNFKTLLTAVANNNLDDLSLDQETLYNYLSIRPTVSEYIYSYIYESLYKSDMYDGLIESLIDIYSCLTTTIYMRRMLVDVDVQPESIIDEYLKEFNFPSRDLFDSIQKKEIARNVYGYLRKKGTPSLLRRILLQLGFDYFFICEYWLTKNDDETTFIFKPEIISEIATLDMQNDWDLFMKSKQYSINQIQNIDPLWLADSSELDNALQNDVMTLPAKTAYYQFGVAATTTENDKLISSMLYACIKKALYNYYLNKDIKDIKYSPYTVSKVSILDLAYAWALINFEYSEIYDIFGLNRTSTSNKFDEEGIKWQHFDMEMVFDTISKKSIVRRKHDNDDVDFDENPVKKYDTDITNKLITENVFGWNGDITQLSIGDILLEIQETFKNTFTILKYYPSQIYYDDTKDRRSVNNIGTRFTDVDTINYSLFVSPALFGDIDVTLRDFKKYNLTFYEWIRAQLALYEDGSTDKANLCLDLIYEIVSSIELYIYNKCNVKINMKQYLISISKFIKVAKSIDKGFTPYHAKMLDPFYVHTIRELPFDQMIMHDMNPNKLTGLFVKSKTQMREVFWRAEYQQIFDADFTEPYAPVFGWVQHMQLPGYDHERTITVNGKTYAPKFDYEFDYVKTTGGLATYSGYKSKTLPHLIENKYKCAFTAMVNELKTEFKIYGEDNVDFLTAKKIMALIPNSMWKPGLNRVSIDETTYHSKFDNDPYIRTLPNTHLDLDINTFDDPRWNDRIDSILLQYLGEDLTVRGNVYVGTILIEDLLVMGGIDIN